MEGNYCTVDEDMPKTSNKRLSMEGNYSTVDKDIQNSSTNKLTRYEITVQLNSMNIWRETLVILRIQN
jgi:hypothetical protein